MNSKSIINVYGRRKIECIFEILSKLNNPNNNEIILKAIGNQINKGIEIAQILKNEVQAQINSIKFSDISIKNHLIPILEIPVELSDKSSIIRDDQPPKYWIDKNFGKEDFINYSTYHLLLDNLSTTG